MNMPETIMFGLVTYCFMVLAFFFPRRRWLHIPVMVTCILFDLAMPFYLYATNDWYKRLIEHEEIFSFLIWCHVGLVLTIYALYIVQVQTAVRLSKGDQASREDHRGQGKAILLVRALVLGTGALLYTPES